MLLDSLGDGSHDQEAQASPSLIADCLSAILQVLAGIVQQTADDSCVATLSDYIWWHVFPCISFMQHSKIRVGKLLLSSLEKLCLDMIDVEFQRLHRSIQTSQPHRGEAEGVAPDILAVQWHYGWRRLRLALLVVKNQVENLPYCLLSEVMLFKLARMSGLGSAVHRQSSIRGSDVEVLVSSDEYVNIVSRHPW